MNALFYASARILSTLIACVVLATILSPHFHPALKAALTSDSFAAHADYLLITLIATISIVSGYLACRLGITKCGILPKVLEDKLFYPFFAFIALCVGYFCWGFDYHSDDEVSQAVQGHIFASGQGKLPPIYCAFVTTLNMVCDVKGVYAQYPPLHAILLWFFHYPSPVLLIASSFFISEITRRYYGFSYVKYVRFGMLLSPFLLIMGMSYMNHVSALFFLSMAAWLFLRKNYYVSFVPLVIGSQVRPLSAAVLACVMGLAILRQERNMRCLLILSAYAGIMLFVHLGANYFSTGDPFLSPFIKLWGDFHLFGFRIDPHGREFDFSRAMIHLGRSIVSLEASLLLLPFSACFLAVNMCLAKNSKYHLAVLLTCLLPIVLFFYWHNGVYAGPRLWFEWLFCFFPVVAYVLRALDLKGQLLCKKIKCKYLLQVTALILASINLYLIFPSHAKLRGIMASGNQLREELSETIAKNSIYFVKVPYQERLIVELRSKLVNASIIEMATSKKEEFRRHGFDICELYYIADSIGEETTIEKISSKRHLLSEYSSNITRCRDALHHKNLSNNSRYSTDVIPLPYLVTLNTFKPGDPLVVRDLGPEKNQEFIDYLLKTEMITRDFKSFFVSADKVGDKYHIRLSERS